MRTALHLIIITALVLLTASCSQQHKAESLVKEYMKAHLKDAESLTIVEFSDIDSTKSISDSLLSRIQERARACKHYQANLPFAPSPASKKLIFSRVAYKLNGEEHTDTYYMDENLEGVVAVKNNE